MLEQKLVVKQLSIKSSYLMYFSSFCFDFKIYLLI